MSWPEDFIFVTYCRLCPDFERVVTEDIYEWRIAVERHYRDARHMPMAYSTRKKAAIDT